MPTIECHALNISATPHPSGIYHQLFKNFAGKRVKYYGDKVAAFSKPSDVKNGLFYGLIITWTEIDKKQPVIDTILLEEPSEETIRKINIPDNIGFNAQSFYYAFRIEDHVLVFESKNAFNATLGPNNAEKILKSIFDDSAILQMPFEGERPEFVEVDLIVQQDALDRIFSIPVLNSLVFTISLANQDDNTAGAEAIISRLRNVHARRQVIEYNALDRKTGLIQDDEMRREGKAALIQGSARGEGTDNGEPVSRNSKQYAKKEAVYINAGASAIDTVIRMAKSLFKRAPEPKTD